MLLGLQNSNLYNNQTIQKQLKANPLNKKTASHSKLGFQRNLTRSAFQAECDIRSALSEAVDRTIPVFKMVNTDFIAKVAGKLAYHSESNIAAGIAARSGGGKTTIIEDSIKEMLGIPVPRDKKDIPPNTFISILNGDNWYKDCSEKLKKAGSFKALLESGYNFDIPNALNLKDLRGTIVKLKKGEHVMGPKYIYGTCENIPGQIPLNPSKLIILDSIFALHPKFNPPKNPVLDFGMFVDVSKDELWRRYAERSKKRGMTPDETQILFDKANKAADKHLHPGIGDLVIDGEAPLGLISNKLGNLFKAISGKRS